MADVNDGEKHYVRLVWTVKNITRDEARGLIPALNAQAAELFQSWEATVKPKRAVGATKATASVDVFVCDAFADLIGSTPVGGAGASGGG